MKKLLLSAAAAVASISATQAGAATIIDSWSIGANLIGGVSVTTPAISHGAVYINQFHYVGHDSVTNAVFDELTNCVDLEHYVATGSYTLPSITTRIPDLTKLRQMLTFVGNATDIVANATGQQKNIDAAAMQLGIWEILYETTNSNYNVATGNFRSSYAGYVSSTDFSAAQTLANSWLNDTVSHAWAKPVGKTLGYLYNPNLQGQVYLRDLNPGEQQLVAGVPEPSQWALMLSGFGLAGWAARRRARKTMAVVTA